MTDGPQAIHGLKKPDLPRNALVISPTQIDTAALCERKWWFLKVKKLPVVQRDFFTFGNVLHKRAELYLRATLQGAVPMPHPGWTTDENRVYIKGPFEGQKIGDPVDLYPDGWDSEITSAEANLIKRLVKKGIDEGILCRQPISLVEQQFWFEVLPGLWLTGILDFAYQWQVEDHKTTKAFRWAKTPEQLTKTAPMLIYAKALLEYFKYEYQDQTILLRHNVFQKDPDDPRVRKVEAQIQKEDVDNFWQGPLTEAARNMLYLRDNAEDWVEVPGPKPGTNACTMYGGCPFQTICSGVATVEEYTERTQAILDNPDNVKEPKKPLGLSDLPKSSKMGLLEDRLNKAKAAAPPQQSLNLPPWAYEHCTVPSCKGRGWNQKGNPCGICSQKSDIPADFYEITYCDGYVELSLEGEPLGQFAGPAQAPVKVEERAAAPAPVEPETPAKVEQEAPEEPAIIEEIEAEEINIDIEPAKKRRGRPKKSFTLAINCAPIRGTAPVKHLDQVFKEIAQQLAEASDRQSYYQINAFQRRDLLAIQAEDIAESLGKDIYIVCPESPDMRAFVDMLRPYASAIWEPFAGTTTIVVEQATDGN